jgi:endo-1,4-beta-mannosidase
MARFQLGVNYWPRSSAMYMWERFDIGEIREDMARIKGLGLDLVRFFLTWEAFQPRIDTINMVALRNLRAIMDAIADAGLQAMPTLFTGHMSGVNWLPAWSLDSNTPHGRFRTIANGETSPYGIGDFYADPALLRAQVLLAMSAGETLREHPALYAWDLGNEFSNLREPNSPSDAAAWSALLTETLLDVSHVGATGGIHGEDLERDRNIRPSSIAAPWAFATMHGYPVYSGFSRGRTDADVVPFLMQTVQACSGKRVLFSELGNPTCPLGTVSPYDRVPLPGEPPLDPKALPANAAPYACLTEDEMAAYAYDVIDRLQKRGALGAMWWCWADYDRSLAALPPFDIATHELHFGIIRNDGSLKPVASTLQRLANEKREVLPEQPPIVDEQSYYASLPNGIKDVYRSYCSTH